MDLAQVEAREAYRIGLAMNGRGVIAWSWPLARWAFAAGYSLGVLAGAALVLGQA